MPPGHTALTRMLSSGVLERGGLGQADDAVLGRAVGRRADAADQARGGGQVDDRAAAPLLEHLGDLVLHAQPDAAQIDADDAIEFIVGHLIHPQRRPLDRCDVRGAVQPAVTRNRALDQLSNLRRLGHVATGEKRVAARGANLSKGFLAAAPVDIRDRDLGARARKRNRTCPRDARGAAGDQNDLSVKIHAALHKTWRLPIALIQ